jgi:hypothetical protein
VWHRSVAPAPEWNSAHDRSNGSNKSQANSMRFTICGASEPAAIGEHVIQSRKVFVMIITGKRLAAGLLAAAIGLAATPSMAVTIDGTVHMSAARAAALRECHERARPYVQYDWGVTELQIYRACMAEHHQPE